MPSTSTPGIEIDRADLQSAEFSLSREWLETNGIGGYASSTLAGANTRRYHGLLVAALSPPLGRAVLLSKLDETVEVQWPDGGHSSCALSTNLFPGTESPSGYRLLESWASVPAPTWIYALDGGIRIEKRVWMPHGSNAAYLSYRLLEQPQGTAVSIVFTPLVAWRDYHAEMHRQDPWPDTGWQNDSTLSVGLPVIPGIAAGPILLQVRLCDAAGAPLPGASFEAGADWYYQFAHPMEAARGLDSTEDLFMPGKPRAPIATDAPVFVTVCTGCDPPPPGEAWEARSARQADLLKRLGDAGGLEQRLALAADQFVVKSPQGRTTVIAGYPWFSDWGRDTMISLPGLTLSTGRPELAREILLSFARYEDLGMLPNRFPDHGETAEYNTVDAALWYFVAAYRYLEATGDEQLIYGDLWAVLENIVRYHLQGTRYGIRVDRNDGLLSAGQSGVQLTWMDAKVGDWVVTPRMGKPVEINALWYNALRTMEQFCERRGSADATARYRSLAERTGVGFNARFPRPDGHGLFDLLDPDDATVRPNQIFAVTLPFAPVAADSGLAARIVDTVRNYLLTPAGLRTLTPNNFNYHSRYEGDTLSRDGAYHQGTAWPWLLGGYAEAAARVTGDTASAVALLEEMAGQTGAMGMGSLAEVYDADSPQRPNGCFAQAWSVAETLRALRALKAAHTGAPQDRKGRAQHG